MIIRRLPSYVLFFIYIVGCTNTSDISFNPFLKQTEKFENGIAFKAGSAGYTVLSLTGNWYNMGRQYGYLAKEELNNFYFSVHKDLIDRGVDSISQINTAKETYDMYSTEMKDLIKGMSETSGLDLNQHIILDASFYLLTIAILNGHPPAACSGIGIFAPRTKDNQVYFGRNWDINREAMIKYMKYLSVIVFNPDNGNGFANVRPLGQTYVETGFNSKGIFIELNNGEASDTSFYPQRRFSGEVILDVLIRSNNIDEAVQNLRSVPAESAYIIQVVDNKKAVSVERATFDSRILEADNGLLVTYNSFVQPYPANWENKLMPPPPTEIDPRRQNILDLFTAPEWEKNLTIDHMLKLMEIEMKDGGAAHDGTVIQVVASPGTFELYFRGFKYSDWAKVDLKQLFTK
jgi:predicted choloylglycine hydrolase